ncbi:DUF3488 domain-containing protein [bacterium]|nr:DUF3488 domain-containing protein [bacterium]
MLLPAALLFWFLRDGWRAGLQPHLVIGDLLAWLTALYTFKLATPRDLRFFALLPLGVAIFVAGLTSSGLFSLTGGVLAAAVLAFVIGAPMLDRVGEERRLRRDWLRTWGRILGKTAAVSLLLAYVSEALAPMAQPRTLGGAFGGELQNATPYRSTNFAYDIVPRLSYSGFSPYLRLDTTSDIHLSDEPALEVTGTPTYWRGVVFDRYTGRAWEVSRLATEPTSPGVAGYRVRPPEYREVEAAAGGDDTLWRRETRRVTMLKGHANFLFAPLIPDRIALASGPAIALRGSGVTLRVSPDGTVQTPFLPDEGFTYHVESLSPRRDAVLDGLLTPRVDYLHLPVIPEEVGSIAKEVVGEVVSARVKMELLADYLGDSSRFNYTLATEPPPPGVDVVHHFLTESREGWCEIFAASLAVMGRQVGVMTRVVGGYSGGEAERPGIRTIRDRDAHVWVEYWMDGAGWILMDPTPEALGPGEAGEDDGDTTAIGAIRNALADLTDRLTLAIWDNLLSRLWQQFRFWALVSMGAVLVWRLARGVLATAPFSARAKLAREFRRWERRGRRWAGRRGKGETIRAYAGRLASAAAPGDLVARAAAFELAMYGRGERPRL